MNEGTGFRLMLVGLLMVALAIGIEFINDYVFYVFHKVIGYPILSYTYYILFWTGVLLVVIGIVYIFLYLAISAKRYLARKT